MPTIDVLVRGVAATLKSLPGPGPAAPGSESASLELFENSFSGYIADCSCFSTVD